MALRAGGEATAVGNAARWLVRTLAWKRPLPGRSGLHVVELSPGYLARIPGISRWAACQAWDVVIGAGLQAHLPVWSHTRVVDEGLTLRHAPTLRWGRYVVLSPAVLAAARQLADRWCAGGYLPEHTPSDGDWRPVTLGRTGATGWQACSCPFHADARPSAAIRWNSTEEGGGFVCHACTRADGAPGRLTGYALRLPDGSVVVRRSDDREGRMEDPRQKPKEDGGDSSEATAPAHMNDVGGSPGGWGAPVPHGTLPVPRVRRVAGAWMPVRAVSLEADFRGLYRSIKHRLSGNIAEIMERAEDRSLTPRAYTEACTAWERYQGRVHRQRDPREFMPDRLYTVGALMGVGRPGPETHWHPPGGWKVVGTTRVLVDIDDVRIPWGWTPGGGIRSAVQDPLTRDVGAVVRTSPTGVQVVVELRYALPVDWLGTAAGRDWYAELAGRVLAAIHQAGGEGGHVDYAACAADRTGRLPGWRILATGEQYRAALVASWGAESKPKKEILPMSDTEICRPISLRMPTRTDRIVTEVIQAGLRNVPCVGAVRRWRRGAVDRLYIQLRTADGDGPALWVNLETGAVNRQTPGAWPKRSLRMRPFTASIDRIVEIVRGAHAGTETQSSAAMQG